MTDEIRKKHEAWKQRWPTESEHVFAILTIADVDALFAELDAERGKVERLEKSAEEHPPHDDKCKCDFCYFARLLRQILTGGGK